MQRNAVMEDGRPASAFDHAPTRHDYPHFRFTNPGTFGGRYMRMFWQPICRSDDLAKGRPVAISIMGSEFALYRGEQRAPHLLPCIASPLSWMPDLPAKFRP